MNSLTLYKDCGLCHQFYHQIMYVALPYKCSLCDHYVWTPYPSTCLICHRFFHTECIRKVANQFSTMHEEEFDDEFRSASCTTVGFPCEGPTIYLDADVEHAIENIPFDYPQRVLPHEAKFRAKKIAQNRARLDTVMKIFFEVMKGKDVTSIQWQNPFKLYDFFLQQVDRFEAEIAQCRKLPLDDRVIHDIHFALIHYHAVYGDLGIWSYILSNDPLNNEQYKARVISQLGWDKNPGAGEIVDFYNDECQHIPMFYVAVDHAWKGIVLSIRGTLTLNDALIDVVNVPVPFLTGSSHTGVVHSATCIANMTLPTLQALQEKYKEYRIYFVGHSLGGAVCVLLHAMWKSTVLPNLSTFTFGAPPCVTEDLEPLCSTDLIQVIHEMDNLPRTSMECIDALIKLLQDLDHTLETQASPDMSKPFYRLPGTIIQIWKKQFYVICHPEACREMFFHVRGAIDHRYPDSIVPNFKSEIYLASPLGRVEMHQPQMSFDDIEDDAGPVKPAAPQNGVVDEKMAVDG